MRNTLEATKGDDLARSVRGLIPAIVAYLLARHAVAWTATSRGMITYQSLRLAGRRGYSVILRTPSLGATRLVAARLLVTAPASEGEWDLIRADMLEDGVAATFSAVHRYLIVPPRTLERALAAMRDTGVVVLSHSAFRGGGPIADKQEH